MQEADLVRDLDKDRTEWNLGEWNSKYAGNTEVMTKEEIASAIQWLRKNNYPKPKDCLEQQCLVFRPACMIGVCRIAVGMCGDF